MKAMLATSKKAQRYMDKALSCIKEGRKALNEEGPELHRRRPWLKKVLMRFIGVGPLKGDTP